MLLVHESILSSEIVPCAGMYILFCNELNFSLKISESKYKMYKGVLDF